MEGSIKYNKKYIKLLLLISFLTATAILFPSCLSTHLRMIREDISEIQKELESIQQENQELNQKVIDIKNNLEELEKRIQEGRINLEEVKNELAMIREKLGLGAYTLPQVEAKGETFLGPARTPEDFYRLSYEKFKKRNYAQAIKEFKTFIERFPDSELISLSQFWLGECYYAQGDWSKAIAEYRKLITLYPFGRKVPDAYLKIGYCYLNLDDKSKALENLQIVVDIFPHSEAASIAKEKIRQLKQKE